MNRSLVFAVVNAPFVVACAASAQCVPAWTQSPGDGPGARYHASMAFDTARNEMVLFGGGGLDGGTGVGSDTWVRRGASWLQLAVSGPSARGDSGMAFDEQRGRIVLFGGLGPDPSYTEWLGDTWEWDGASWSLVAESGPSPRAGAPLAHDSKRGRVVLFGGANGACCGAGDHLDDTWEWDGSQWLQVASGGPPSRAGHGLAYDPIRQRVVMFGGSAPGGSYRADTWEWDGAAWELKDPGGDGRPRAGANVRMAFDEARGVVVHYSSQVGGTCEVPSETWAWDGHSWSVLTDVPPTPPRVDSAFAFDRARGCIVLFGGIGCAIYGDTWELKSPGPAITDQPDSQSVPNGQPVEFSVQVSPSEGAAYQWRRDGIALSDGGRISGSAAATLRIDPAHAADAGTYDVVVTSPCGVTTSDPADLSVDCRPDCNRDGRLNVNDFICFQNEWRRRTPYGDYDGSRSYTINDFVRFQADFARGCP